MPLDPKHPRESASNLRNPHKWGCTCQESRNDPQEQELVNELFDRLAEVERNPRHPDAEHLIAVDCVRRPSQSIRAGADCF